MKSISQGKCKGASAALGALAMGVGLVGATFVATKEASANHCYTPEKNSIFCCEDCNSHQGQSGGQSGDCSPMFVNDCPVVECYFTGCCLIC